VQALHQFARSHHRARCRAPVPQTTTDIVNLPSFHDISRDENPSVAGIQHNFVTFGEIRLVCLPGHLQRAKQFRSDIRLWFVRFCRGASIASRVLPDIDSESLLPGDFCRPAVMT
jgi:hypothetical protein